MTAEVLKNESVLTKLDRDINLLLKQGFRRREVVNQLTDVPTNISRKTLERIIKEADLSIKTPQVVDLIRRHLPLRQVVKETSLPYKDIHQIIRTNLEPEEYRVIVESNLINRYKEKPLPSPEQLKPYLVDFRTPGYIGRQIGMSSYMVEKGLRKLLGEEYSDYQKKAARLGHYLLDKPVSYYLTQIESLIEQKYTHVQILKELSLGYFAFKFIYELKQGNNYHEYLTKINRENKLFQHYREYLPQIKQYLKEGKSPSFIENKLKITQGRLGLIMEKWLDEDIGRKDDFIRDLPIITDKLESHQLKMTKLICHYRLSRSTIENLLLKEKGEKWGEKYLPSRSNCSSFDQNQIALVSHLSKVTEQLETGMTTMTKLVRDWQLSKNAIQKILEEKNGQKWYETYVTAHRGRHENYNMRKRKNFIESLPQVVKQIEEKKINLAVLSKKYHVNREDIKKLLLRRQGLDWYRQYVAVNYGRPTRNKEAALLRSLQHLTRQIESGKLGLIYLMRRYHLSGKAVKNLLIKQNGREWYETYISAKRCHLNLIQVRTFLADLPGIVSGLESKELNLTKLTQKYHLARQTIRKLLKENKGQEWYDRCIPSSLGCCLEKKATFIQSLPEISRQLELGKLNLTKLADRYDLSKQTIKKILKEKNGLDWYGLYITTRRGRPPLKEKTVGESSLTKRTILIESLPQVIRQFESGELNMNQLVKNSGLRKEIIVEILKKQKGSDWYKTYVTARRGHGHSHQERKIAFSRSLDEIIPKIESRQVGVVILSKQYHLGVETIKRLLEEQKGSEWYKAYVTTKIGWRNSYWKKDFLTDLPLITQQIEAGQLRFRQIAKQYHLAEKTIRKLLIENKGQEWYKRNVTALQGFHRHHAEKFDEFLADLPGIVFKVESKELNLKQLREKYHLDQKTIRKLLRENKGQEWYKRNITALRGYHRRSERSSKFIADLPEIISQIESGKLNLIKLSKDYNLDKKTVRKLLKEEKGQDWYKRCVTAFSGHSQDFKKGICGETKNKPVKDKRRVELESIGFSPRREHYHQEDIFDEDEEISSDGIRRPPGFKIEEKFPAYLEPFIQTAKQLLVNEAGISPATAAYIGKFLSPERLTPHQLENILKELGPKFEEYYRNK
ncbi:MAG TPA: hypothetical protein P5299_00090, partial [Candidatus Woesebacteria bacterium]|nr:hypothetical protein [Candidatus Woesebacteria bacterium]